MRNCAGLARHVIQRLLGQGNGVHDHVARAELTYNGLTDAARRAGDECALILTAHAITPAPLTMMFSPAMLTLSVWVR